MISTDYTENPLNQCFVYPEQVLKAITECDILKFSLNNTTKLSPKCFNIIEFLIKFTHTEFTEIIEF